MAVLLNDVFIVAGGCMTVLIKIWRMYKKNLWGIIPQNKKFYFERQNKNTLSLFYVG